MTSHALSLEQAHNFFGCTGYALWATIAGEELSDPHLTYWCEEGSLLLALVLSRDRKGVTQLVLGCFLHPDEQV